MHFFLFIAFKLEYWHLLQPSFTIRREKIRMSSWHCLCMLKQFEEKRNNFNRHNCVNQCEWDDVFMDILLFVFLFFLSFSVSVPFICFFFHLSPFTHSLSLSLSVSHFITSNKNCINVANDGFLLNYVPL